MVHLAVYDAVVAIEGGYAPFSAHKKVRPQPNADVRAAVATAAYLTARAKVAASQIAYLDRTYTGYIAGLPGGVDRTAGITIGAKAAAAILEQRAADELQQRGVIPVQRGATAARRVRTRQRVPR